MDDSALARMLAEHAGAALKALQRSSEPGLLGTRELKDLGDRTSQDLLAAALAEHRPADAILSEEAKDDPARHTAERVWIIDPLDGTREFSEGREDWAVHVALWSAGDLIAGAVALPGLGITLGADDPVRSWPTPYPVRIAVSRTRPTALVVAVAQEMGAELVPMGSAGFKASAVVRGEVDAYLHTGGQYEWDSAAPVAVARAAGLFTARIDGSPLEYNRENPYLPDLMICNPSLADELLRRVRANTVEGE
ncbi:3'(2'),5'-bisphosphate nucleotidase CysQ [Microbacterium sp. bgisy189]|uniref:3'(2'),5'-bisphosphate nucleotidase CysQ n=1 Tax=Microbacterium sp. bgisy189 TaxID=3413798 RepID=UPI003EBD449B